MKFVTATTKDIPTIQKLNHEIMAKNIDFDEDININFDLTDIGHEFFKEAIESSEGCFFLAYKEDELIGYGNGSIKTYPYRFKKYFEIENIGIDPKYRNKGYGSQIMTKLVDWAKARHCERLRLNCYSANYAALSFYKKFGLKEIDVTLEKDI